ncbi:hypothetical protein [Loktanella sp. Alg231-35]|uniref:hypothetical protein n=1 Tax=Loktanella sp. Alg231-35 TaxID=1922220 RepID=UPI00131F0958|nr:hypothetical protein [Loktanella sp. Alg231-35]
MDRMSVCRAASGSVYGFLGILLVLILSIWGAVLPHKAHADETLRYITFGAPSGFESYLDTFSLFNGSKCEADCSVDRHDANLIVVFAPSFEDNTFIPAVLRPVFLEIVRQERFHVYNVPATVFGESLNSDVQFIVTEELVARVRQEQLLSPAGDVDFGCAAAGVVMRNWSREGPIKGIDWSGIFEACQVM